MRPHQITTPNDIPNMNEGIKDFFFNLVKNYFQLRL